MSHSCIWLFVTPWTLARQAPLSMGFLRQEYWSGDHPLLQGSSQPRERTGFFLHCRQILHPLSHQGRIKQTNYLWNFFFQEQLKYWLNNVSHYIYHDPEFHVIQISAPCPLLYGKAFSVPPSLLHSFFHLTWRSNCCKVVMAKANPPLLRLIQRTEELINNSVACLVDLEERKINL